jgi:hypothetical protein
MSLKILNYEFRHFVSTCARRIYYAAAQFCCLPLSLVTALQKLIKNEYMHCRQTFYELERVCIRKTLQKLASVESSKLIVVIFGIWSVRIPVGILFSEV